MRRALALLLLLVLGCGAASAATLTATLDRTAIEMGDNVTLILSLSGGDSSSPPDLSGLSRDFDIVDRRRGSRPANIDGRLSTVNDWVLTIAPKRTGTLTIPAFSLSGASSAPLKLTVSAASQPQRTDARPLFVEVDAPKGGIYPLSEVPVYVRIYDSIGLRAGSISQIQAQGASFTAEGEQENYVRTIGKTRYHVIQQTYVMTPQRSGTIEIEPVTLKATVPMPSGTPPSEMARLLGRDPASMPWLQNALSRGQEINLHSEKISVNVLPRPAGAQGWFLPASAVAVSQTLTPEGATHRVGETLTRTIRIEATGASPNQMPPVDIEPVADVRQYEESSKTESAILDRAPGAILTKTVSVVATRPGAITLPAIVVPWWNTTTNRQEQTVLPPLTFAVSPGATAPAPPPVAASLPTPQPEPAAPEPAEPAPVAGSWAAGALAALLGAGSAVAGHLPLVGALAFALAMLVALLLLPRLLRARRAGAKAAPIRLRPGKPDVAGAGDAHSAARALEKAARADAPAAAYSAYLSWQRVAPPSMAAHPALVRAIRDLEQHLYGAPAGQWRGGALVAALKTAAHVPPRRRAAQGLDGLAPLYPQG